MYGVNNFNALINPPQVGILAVGKIRDKVKLASENIKKEKYAIFTITCDHRIIDGRYAARFLGDLKVIIENPKKII